MHRAASPCKRTHVLPPNRGCGGFSHELFVGEAERGYQTHQSNFSDDLSEAGSVDLVLAHAMSCAESVQSEATGSEQENKSYLEQMQRS